MKIFRLLSLILFLSACVCACSDNEDENPGEEGGGSITQVAAAFEKETLTVLKNVGEIQIPIVLRAAPAGTVKLTVGVKAQPVEGAAEGIDFTIKEKIISIEKGQTIAHVNVILLDDGKAATDKSFVIEIKNVYGFGMPAGDKQACTVSIVNNAFIEFGRDTVKVIENAGPFGVPLLITGEIKEPATLRVRVAEGATAIEGTNFRLLTPEITLQPGQTEAVVGLEAIDDQDINADRSFVLEFIDIKGSNALIGTGKPVCNVMILNDEIAKEVSFLEASYTVEEDGETVTIPVILDKPVAQGETANVTIAVKKTSSAMEGADKDFVIETKTLTFGAGSKKQVLTVKINDDALFNADRVAELEIRDVEGANVLISETNATCNVNIKNNDVIYFDMPAYTPLETAGEQIIPVHFKITPFAGSYTLTLESVLGANTTAAHFSGIPQELVFNDAKVNVQDLSVKIGYTDDWVDPTVQLRITKINNVATSVEAETMISEVACDYRKLLGVWEFVTKTPDNCNTPVDITFSGGTTEQEKIDNFNKKIRCVGKVWKGMSTDVYWELEFNEKDQSSLNMLLNKRAADGGFNFGAADKNNCVMRYVLSSNNAATSLKLPLDKEAMVISWPDKCGLGGFQSDQGNAVVWGLFHTNATMTKK